MDCNGALVPTKINEFCNVESDRMQRTPNQIVQLLESFSSVLAPTFGVNFVPHLTRLINKRFTKGNNNGNSPTEANACLHRCFTCT